MLSGESSESATCGSAYHGAREVGALDHEVLWTPPAYTNPFVKWWGDGYAEAQNDALPLKTAE